MIRPSMLNRAELCGLAPALAARFPETSDSAEDGTGIHAEIPAAWRGEPAKTPEAIAAVEWLRGYLATMGESRVAFERKVYLVDDDGNIVTEGTADLLIEEQDLLTVGDWKSGEPDNVPEADDNLQLIAYGLAACDGKPFRVGLIFLDGDKVDTRWSRVFEPSEHQALLARVKAAASRPAVAQPGDHCASCYQRHYCDAFKARVSTALVACGQPAPTELDSTSAAKLDAMIAMVDGDNGWLALAKAARSAYIRGGGELIRNGKRAYFSTCKGRESADVDKLRADGLDRYIKRGGSFERLSWKKVRQ